MCAERRSLSFGAWESIVRNPGESGAGDPGAGPLTEFVRRKKKKDENLVIVLLQG